MKRLTFALIMLLSVCQAQYYQGFDGDINDVPELTVKLNTDSAHSYAWVTGITGYIEGPGFMDTCNLWFKRRSSDGSLTSIAVWTGTYRASATRSFYSLDTDTAWMRYFVQIPPGGNYYMYFGSHTEVDSIACDGTPSRVLFVRSDGVAVWINPNALDVIVQEKYFDMSGREIQPRPGMVMFKYTLWESGRVQTNTIYITE